MTIGWAELLLAIAWIGPFTFAGFFTLIERKYPDGQYPKESHVKVNFLFGGMTALISFCFLQTMQDSIGATMSVFDFVDFSDPVLPEILHYSLCFLFIDFVYYAQHRLSHHISLLWRLHKVHHGDDRVTASTSLVHHPLEAIFVSATAFSIYVLVNMPLGVILSYGAVNAVHVAFVHSNITMPRRLEWSLSKIIYTPRLHKIHHSIRMDEGNSNFGMIFVIWDQMLRSWRSSACVSHEALQMGIEDFKHPRWNMTKLLLLPFK